MSTKLVVVTGSNRGIGQGIIQLLAKTQHDPPLTIYATSRAGVDLNIQGSHNNEVRYSKLDVGDKSPPDGVLVPNPIKLASHSSTP